jgi:hypothetical protein
MNRARDQWMYYMIKAMQQTWKKHLVKLAEQLYGVADFMRVKQSFTLLENNLTFALCWK